MLLHYRRAGAINFQLQNVAPRIRRLGDVAVLPAPHASKGPATASKTLRSLAMNSNEARPVVVPERFYALRLLQMLVAMVMPAGGIERGTRMACHIETEGAVVEHFRFR